MNTNSKRFFEALQAGEEWVPIRPRQHELKSNSHVTAASVPTSNKGCEPKAISHWVLKVTGPSEWGLAETENCMGLVSGVESAERNEKELLLHLCSEAELLEAINAIDGRVGVEADRYVATRVATSPRPA